MGRLETLVRQAEPTQRSNLFVITGTVGVGKTSLTEELGNESEYFATSELAAGLIREQIRVGGRLIPWLNRRAFEVELLRRRIRQYEEAPKGSLSFFDRAIPEAIPFFRSEFKSAPEVFLEASQKYRYNDVVFFLPPWEKIYENSPTRPQKFSEALHLSKLLWEAYEELGYEMVEVPKVSVRGRVEFVKSYLRSFL